MLIDSRLHITIRPCLEYKIPELCLLARDCVLGDRNFMDLKSMCDQCLKHFEFQRTQCPKTSILQDESTAVCHQVDEYLRCISASWKAYLDVIIRRVRKKLEELQSRRVTETSRTLQRDLNSFLKEIRSFQVPLAKRPNALLQSSSTFQDMFTSAYGKVPSRDLKLVKEDFENKMASIQHRIATRFVTLLLADVNHCNELHHKK